MASIKVERILEEIKNMSREEREELLQALRREPHARQKCKISDIEGLGADLWEGVDVEKYIDDERSSWD
jgi:hypothetical protein